MKEAHFNPKPGKSAKQQVCFYKFHVKSVVVISCVVFDIKVFSSYKVIERNHTNRKSSNAYSTGTAWKDSEECFETGGIYVD